MARSHLPSKFDQEALIERANTWLINFLPVARGDIYLESLLSG